MHNKITRFLGAWRQSCPERRIGGDSLPDADAGLQPFLDAQQQVGEARQALRGAVGRHKRLKRAAAEQYNRYVYAIKGDKELGVNSELVRQVGLKMEIEKRRRRPATPKPALPAEPTGETAATE